MALLVHLDTNNERAEQLSIALRQIRDGIAVFKKFDGTRAQTIGVSAAEFGAAFGITDPAEAQAFSDRWGAISAGNYSGMSDFLDATLDGLGAQ